MRALLIFLLSPLFFVAPMVAGTCTGADPCPACKDCTKCKFCDPKGKEHGSCGTLRAQNEAEARKRLKKRPE